MKPLSFEAMYPTRTAREYADRLTDSLDIQLPLSEHIRCWEYHYLAKGGLVRGPKKT